MHIRIFTLPFDGASESFPDELVAEFCENKKVHQVQSHFFLLEGRPYWSVSVHFEIVAKGSEKLRELDEDQKLLYERMREWRKERAHKLGIPVYLIATNEQLARIVRMKVFTVEGLKSIKGFGKSRIENYGRQLLAVAQSFYEEKQRAAKPNSQPIDTPF